MNRKGEASPFDVARKAIYWLIAGTIITMVVFVYAFSLVGYKNQLVYIPPQLPAELISLRFTNIPECFAYQDAATGRVYPGIIDLNKFNDGVMEDCYHTEAEKGYEDYNFRLQLEKKGNTIRTNNYFNKDDFTIIKKVLVKDGMNLVEDNLLIYVQEKI